MCMCVMQDLKIQKVSSKVKRYYKVFYGGSEGPCPPTFNRALFSHPTFSSGRPNFFRGQSCSTFLQSRPTFLQSRSTFLQSRSTFFTKSPHFLIFHDIFFELMIFSSLFLSKSNNKQHGGKRIGNRPGKTIYIELIFIALKVYLHKNIKQHLTH